MVSKRPSTGRIDRRRFIEAAGAAGIAAFAGCTGGSDGGSEGTSGGDTDESTSASEGTTAGNAGGDVTTLSFWTLFTGGDGAAMKRLVQKFNDEHDDVQIQRERQPFDQYYEKLYTSMTGGSAPDLSVLHSSKQLQFADGSIPLDDYTSGDPYVDSIWERTAPTGTHYGLPLGTFVYGLYYNKDIFEEAGLDPESPPTNYQEFEAAANAITENTDKLAFNPEPYGAPYNYMFTAWVKSAGGEFLNEDKTAAAFDSPAGRSVGQFYRDITENGWDKADASSMRGVKAFRNGDLGMTLNGTWFQLVLRDLDINWGHGKPWVLPDAEEKLTWGGTHIINVPRQNGLSDEEIQTRVDAAEWLTQEGKIWATEAGHVPTLDGVSSQLEDTEVWDLTLKNYVEMVNDNQVAYWPIVENRDDYTRPVDQNVAQIYSQQIEPDEGIANAAKQVTDNLQS